MVDSLPDTLKKLAVDLEVVDPSGRPLHQPFYAPDNPERADKFEYWQKKREEPLAAAVAKNENAEALLEELPMEPFAECLTRFEEQAQEARFRDTLLAPAPTLQESFNLYSKKVNTEAEMGAMIVIYELDLALEGISVVDGKVDINNEGDTLLRERLGGLQDLIDAGPQAIFIVGHIGEAQPIKVEEEHEWDNAASPATAPSLEPVFEVVESMYSGAAPVLQFIGVHDFVLGTPIPNLREEPEGRVYMVENLNQCFEELGVLRLENGKVKRMPFAEREGFCQRAGWKMVPEFYVLDSFAAANQPFLVSEGLWEKVPQRVLGANIEAQIQEIMEILKIVPAAEEEEKDDDPYADIPDDDEQKV